MEEKTKKGRYEITLNDDKSRTIRYHEYNKAEGKSYLRLRNIPSDEDLVKMLENAGFRKNETVMGIERLGKKRDPIAYRGIEAAGKISMSDGLKELGFLPYRMTQEEVTEKLREIYPLKLVKRAYERNLDINLLSPTEFQRQYKRFYQAHNKQGRPSSISFRKKINSLYPEFPNLYSLIRKKKEMSEINLDDLKEKLNNLKEKGEDLSPTSLGRNHRRIHDDLMMVATNKLVGRCGKSIVRTMARLMNWKEKDISLQKDKTYVLGELGELYAKFFFFWTKIANPSGSIYGQSFKDIFPEDIRYVGPETNGLEKFCLYHDSGINFSARGTIPDLRVNNSAIEIKTGLDPFSYMRVEQFLKKYSPYHEESEDCIKLWNKDENREELQKILNNFKDYEKVDKTVIIFNCPKEAYQNELETLKKHKISFISTESFANYLEILVKHLEKKPWINQIERLKPKISNLRYFIDLYNEIVYKPNMLQKRGNKDRLSWSFEGLRNLVAAGENLSEHH